MKHKKIYGKIFKSHFGPQLVVSVADRDLVAEVLRAEGVAPQRANMESWKEYRDMRGRSTGLISAWVPFLTFWPLCLDKDPLQFPYWRCRWATFSGSAHFECYLYSVTALNLDFKNKAISSICLTIHGNARTSPRPLLPVFPVKEKIGWGCGACSDSSSCVRVM